MPKALFWLTGLLGLTQVLVILYFLGAEQDANGRVVRFETAQRCVQETSMAPLNNAGIAGLLDQLEIVPGECWQTIILPENHPAQDLQLDYRYPRLRKIRYHLAFKIPESWPANTPLMIYVPRIFANAWQLKVNNRLIADNRLEWRSTWLRPLGIHLNDDDLSPDKRLNIDLAIIISEVEGYSMSRISVGDARAVSSEKILRDYLQVILPQAEGISIFLMGLFFVSFWLARKAESEYLILAFASFSLSIFFCRYVISYQPADPAMDAWYHAIISDTSMPWFSWLSFLFAAKYGEFTFPFWEKLLWLNAIVLSLVTLSPLSLDFDLSILKAICGCLINTVSIGIICWQAVIRNNHGLRIMAAVSVITLILGVHDFALVLNRVNPENYLLGPLSLFLIFASYLYAIQLRYASAITNQEQLNLDLSEQLAEKERLTKQLSLNETELRTQQNRLLDYERVQALAEERQRLMHDMHDGLGSSLLTTLAAIEKKNLPQAEVAEALRNCIEDLRLIIDSLEPAAQDVVSLLATIRYRLGHRLAAAELKLDWQINDLPALPWFEPPDALNLLRLVQEALVNVLKHAKASRVLVTTSFLGSSVEVLIQDNGCGYDPKSVSLGRGTPSQFKRAERLGGTLKINSTLGQGTAVRLLLPLNKKQ